MRTYVLFILLFSFSFTTWATDNQEKIPEIDKELFSNIYNIMHLPEGTHKIYNGQGSSVFDVLYTIDVIKNKWTVYKGGTKSVFDIIYTVVRSNDGLRIYKGSADSVFNILYTVKMTGRGIEVYKGDSTFSSNLIYSYEKN